jgi:hypothetical protein
MTFITFAEWAVLIHFNLVDKGWAYWRVGAIAAVIILVYLFKKAYEGDEKALFGILCGLVFPWVLGVLYIVGLSLYLWHLPTLKDIDYTPLVLFQVMCITIGLALVSIS